RDREGVVDAADYERLRAEIADRLRKWRDPVNGNLVMRKVWTRDELYVGECKDMAPDLILDLATPGGYSYVGLPSGGRPGPTVRRLARGELSGGKLRGMSGSHRAEGFFALSGPSIQHGRMEGASIIDMAPTILALTGVPIPMEWDGRVLPCLA